MNLSLIMKFVLKSKTNKDKSTEIFLPSFLNHHIQYTIQKRKGKMYNSIYVNNTSHSSLNSQCGIHFFRQYSNDGILPWNMSPSLIYVGHHRGEEILLCDMC